MQLPNGAQGIVDIRKLRDYCLNPDNPRGSNKARVFAAALGLTAADAKILQNALLDAARHSDAVLGELDVYGQRYTVEFEMVTAIGAVKVRSGWIILHGEVAPRLTTCYVVGKRG